MSDSEQLSARLEVAIKALERIIEIVQETKREIEREQGNADGRQAN